MREATGRIHPAVWGVGSLVWTRNNSIYATGVFNPLYLAGELANGTQRANSDQEATAVEFLLSNVIPVSASIAPRSFGALLCAYLGQPDMA